MDEFAGILKKAIARHGPPPEPSTTAWETSHGERALTG
jgi:hypothetical protein